MTLSAEDRIAIHELVSLHGHLADNRTYDGLDQLLTEDAVYDLERLGMGKVAGMPALRALFEAAPGEQPTGHHVTNIMVTERPDDSAEATSKALVVMADGRAGSAVYHDHVVRTPAGWRIAYRTVTPREK